MESSGVHRETLMLVQGVVEVMVMQMMMVISGFRCGVSPRLRTITNRVSNKRVHIGCVHADRRTKFKISARKRRSMELQETDNNNGRKKSNQIDPIRTSRGDVKSQNFKIETRKTNHAKENRATQCKIPKNE